jgi:hypothetical protein
MIGKMLGGIAAVVGGSILGKAKPKEYKGTAIVDGRLPNTSKYGDVNIPIPPREFIADGYQWKGGDLHPQPPTNIQATRLTNGNLSIEWEARNAGRSLASLTGSLERYQVEIIRGSR